MNDYYEQLSESARIRRIAELLSKGVTLKLIHDRKARESAQDVIEEDARTHECVSSDKALSNMLDYIVRCGPLSPKEIQAHFSMPRKTAYRRLKSLQDARLIEKTGNTRSCQFMQRLTH